MLQTLTRTARPWLVGASLAALLTGGGCALRPQTTSADGHCYTESGWLDATNGCASRAGYPDCYLICPETNVRRRL